MAKAKRMKKSVNNKKIEFSKMLCVVASFVLVLLGGWMIWKYYNLIELAIQTDSASTPDSALPIAGITAIITPVISYLLYQAKLKDSRNKYGISEAGVPYCMPETENNE